MTIPQYCGQEHFSKMKIITKKEYINRMTYYSKDKIDRPHNEALKYVQEGDIVLSAGCGSGREVLFLNNKRCKITAIDYDKEMIDCSKNIIDNKNIEYILGDFSKFERKEYYNKVVCLFNTIPFLNKQQLEDFTKNSYINLRKGGSLIITFMDRWGSFNSAMHYLLGHNKNYTKRHLFKLLSRFKINHFRIGRYLVIIATK